MEPAATIRQLRLDVQTTNAQLGRELPERFSQLFHGELTAVLTDELARVAASGPAFRLSELVLELPPVAAGRLEQDLPDALRAALRRALADLRPGGKAGAAQAAPDSLAGLRYFLLNGRLPWQLNSPAFALDAAVGRALRQHPRALLALLREVGEQAWPRQRLARQLAPATIGEVIGLLAPADAPLVRAYLGDTLAAHRRRPLVPAPEPALRQVLHELVLADLLTRWHTQFNRRAFVERQLRQLAAHYSLNLTALLRQLVAVLPLAGPSQPQTPTLPGIVHAFYQQLNPDNTLTANAAPAGDSAVSAALLHYLRYGSLPPGSSSSATQAVLAAKAMKAVGQGRGALLALAHAAGGRAAAGLLALLPPGEHPGLVRQLAPGQARPVLALLDELTRPAGAGAHRPQLWQQAIALLLKDSVDAITPTLRRWLPLQVPELLVVAARGTAREQLFHYLLTGAVSSPGSVRWSPAQLRRELAGSLAQRDRTLPDFLRQHRASQSVLRHLAALAGFGLLTRLLPGAARSGARRTATLSALAALLGEAGLGNADSSVPGQVRQQMLREAYLHFHLRGPAGASGAGARTLHQLLRAYQLPARALLGYLRHQLRRWPVLAGSSFFRWLLDGAATSTAPYSGLPNERRAARRTEAAGGRKLSGVSEEGAFLRDDTTVGKAAAPAAGIGAWRRTGSVSQIPGAEQVGELPFQPEAGARQLPADSLWLQSGPTARAAMTVLRPGGQIATNDAGLAINATMTALRPVEPALRQRMASAGVAAALHLAWPATAAEGLARLAAYVPAQAATSGWVGPLLRWVSARQPTQVADWLIARLVAGRRWPGPAVLLDFALLHQLLASARPAVRQGLAALEKLAHSELSGSPRLLALLRATVLLGYFRPANAAGLLPRLTATYGLPQRATATKLRRLAQRWPALAAVSGWQQLMTVLAGPGASGSKVGITTARSASRPARQFGASQEIGLMANDLQIMAGPLAETAPARHDLLFHYLLHGRAPWWHSGPLLPATLGQALRRAATPPQPLREFLRQHGREAPVQRHLAALADFSLLHELLPPPGVGRGRRQLVRPALMALDRSLRRPAGASQERLRLFLQEAYLAYAGGTSAADPLTAARQRAAAGGLAWRTVLAWAATLLRQHPALAADPFFAALLQATLSRPGSARTRLRASEGVGAGLGAEKAVLSEAAEVAWLLVEQYVQAGSAPAAAQATAALTALLPAQAVEVLARARPYLGSATARQRLAALLLPGIVERLLRRWWPGAYRPLAQVARGWLRLRALGLVQATEGPAGVWAAVLDVAVAGGSRPQQLAALLGA